MSLPVIAIVAAQRTPMGSFQGNFKNLSTPVLGSAALKGALESLHFPPQEVEEVFMGCVLPAGLGQAPARQAMLEAGLPPSAGATTVNKVCGSGMKAIMLAHDSVQLGTSKIVLAGGMENMSRSPYLLDKARSGYRMGHGALWDHMILDGLQDAYNDRSHMGVLAEKAAERFQISREAQDAFAIESGKRALKAMKEENFKAEITPVSVEDSKEVREITEDEPPTKLIFEKVPSLKPAFKKEGTITAANASSISDGAAAVLLMREDEAQVRGLKPLALIRGHVTFSQEPEWFTSAPVGAIKKLMGQVGWTLETVDLFEINEAFAVVTLIAMQELELSHERVNVHGGACALGHPIGASGARLVVTLVHALRQKGLKRGVACLCIGGGEATALAIEIARGT